MKLRKICAIVISAAIAFVSLATSVSAYLVVPAEDEPFLSVDNAKWSMSIPKKYDIDFSQVYQLYVLVKLTNEEAYLADKESGFYSDGETEFVDFQGAVSVGGPNWHQFTYNSLAETEGTPQTDADSEGGAGIKSFGNGNYAFTATFSNVKIQDASQIYTLNFNEWGNRSSDYSLEILEVSLIGADGSTIVSYNSVGDMLVAPPIVETTTEAITEPPVETTVETTTTTEATTTTAAETTEETTSASDESETEDTATETQPAEETTTTTTTVAETTTVEITTSEETTAAATTTAAVQQAVGGSSVDFSQRNSQLLIFAIAAIAVIVIAVVVFIVISLKKKK